MPKKEKVVVQLLLVASILCLQVNKDKRWYRNNLVWIVMIYETCIGESTLRNVSTFSS